MKNKMTLQEYENLKKIDRKEVLERMKKSRKGQKHSEKRKSQGYTYLKGINKGEKNESKNNNPYIPAFYIRLWDSGAGA